MEDLYAQMDDAFDRLWEECGCAHKDTTNVEGNLVRRAANAASNETKVKAARKRIEPAVGE